MLESGFSDVRAWVRTRGAGEEQKRLVFYFVTGMALEQIRKMPTTATLAKVPFCKCDQKCFFQGQCGEPRLFTVSSHLCQISTVAGGQAFPDAEWVTKSSLGTKADEVLFVNAMVDFEVRGALAANERLSNENMPLLTRSPMRASRTRIFPPACAGWRRSSPSRRAQTRSERSFNRLTAQSVNQPMRASRMRICLPDHQ
eukprot:9494383-Pyramimonas_sp.AAC.2